MQFIYWNKINKDIDYRNINNFMDYSSIDWASHRKFVKDYVKESVVRYKDGPLHSMSDDVERNRGVITNQRLTHITIHPDDQWLLSSNSSIFI